MTALPPGLPDNLLALLRAALPQTPPDAIGHDDFARHPDPRHQGPAVFAAVLIPVIAREKPGLLFTRRTEHLSRHSGQVSFPGGRSETHDLSPAATALRETEEETGIAPVFVSIAGFLPRYRTATGFDIAPVVGVVKPGFTLAPDPREVAKVFEVELAFFLDPANQRRGTRELAGQSREFPVYEPDGHYIWGVTAALVSDLAARLRSAHAIQAP